ncbi:hypothetical protein B0H63DRAFT_435675, partial [Podospora didyma]
MGCLCVRNAFASRKSPETAKSTPAPAANDVALELSGGGSPLPTRLNLPPEPNLPPNDTKTPSHRAADELWDLAYLSVRDGDAKLVEAYELVLARVVELDGDSLQLGPGSNEPVDETGRQEHLKAMVQRGLERTEKWAAAKEKAGGVVDVIRGVDEFISSSLSSVPQAAAAWVAVSILLKGFSNAATQSIANREGIVYVGSRARWYHELFHVINDFDRAQGLRLQLEEHLISLFVKIIIFQMRSVGAYFRVQIVAILRDAFSIDDWNGSLEEIRAAEASLNVFLEQYGTATNNNLLRCQAERAAKLLDVVRDGLGQINTTLAEILQHQRDVGRETQINRSEDAEKEALRQANALIGKFKVPGLEYDQFMDNNPDPVKGTCQWFHKDERVNKWVTGPHSLLLVRARPGQGKSVLARSLVHAWREQNNKAVCHFFFKDTNEVQKSVSMALCAILHQLFRSDPLVALKVEGLIMQNGAGLMTSKVDLWNIFEAVMLHAKSPIICALDALDECGDGDRDFLIGRISELCNGRRTAALGSKLKLLATTRPLDGIMIQFQGVQSISLDPIENPALLAFEINMVIDARMDEMAKAKRWDTELRDDMKAELRAIGGVQYTYLWLRLIFELLGKKSLRPKQDWLLLVRQLPRTVNEAYERLLSNVDEDLKPVVQKLLKIMLGVGEPLNVSQMNVALGVYVGRTMGQGLKYMDGNSQFREWIENNCGFFVQVFENDLVLFIHQTAKEFLTCRPISTPPSSNSGWECFTTLAAAHMSMSYVCRSFL